MPKGDQLDLFTVTSGADPAATQRMVDAIPANREKLRVDEVCAILNNCTREHIYNLICDGSILAVNIARDPNTRPLYRIYTSSIRQFLQKRMEGAR